MRDSTSERSYDCVHCGGSVEEGFTTSESYERSGSIVLVKEIPCERCRQCGATFLSDDVFAVVERQTEAAFERGSELTVLRYGADGIPSSTESLPGMAVTQPTAHSEVEEQEDIVDQ